MSDTELDKLEAKAVRNELRAREAEARLRILRAELAINDERNRIQQQKNGSDQ